MRELATAPDTTTIGLRFDRSEAPKLRALADRVKADDLTSDVAAFEQAALAAESGEPLRVVCQNLEEVYRMVAGYILQGIKRPAIEELNS